MTFPTVVDRASGGNSGASANFIVIPIPASAVAGDTLLIAYSHRFGSVNGTWPSGWTVLLAEHNGGQSMEEARYKVLTSGDISTGSVTINYTGNVWTSWVTVLMRNAQSLEASSWTASGDPPSLTPSWGAKDTLWIALSAAFTTGYGSGNWSCHITGFPSGYSNTMAPLYGESSIGYADKQLNAASENPGAFTWLDGPYNPDAATIAVQPAPPKVRAYSPGIIG